MAEANAINAATTGIVGNTGTSFTGTAATQYNVIVGGSTSSTLSNVAPSATSGIPLISQGSSSNPTFGTAVVAGGGTGVATLTGLALGSGTSAFTGVTYTAKSSFTPVLTFGGASTGITYSVQSGTYQQIGNMVFFNIEIILSSVGSATGGAAITGLPVTVSATAEIPIILVAGSLTATYLYAYCQLTGTSAVLYEGNISGGQTQLANTNFTSSSQLWISGVYFV